MSEPNGQRGATTPSNSSTPVPRTETVPRATKSTVTEGDGKPTNSASTPQAMRTSIHAGEAQASGDSSNAAGQNRDHGAPGSGRGRGAAPPSISTSRASSRAPTEGPRDQATPVHSPRKRDFDAMAEAYKQFVSSKKRKSETRAIPRDQLHVEVNAFNDIVEIHPKRSDVPQTNFMIQDHGAYRYRSINAKIRLGTADGIKTLMEVSRIVGEESDSHEIIWTARPLRNSDAEDECSVTDPGGIIRPGSPAVQNSRMEEHPNDDDNFVQRPASTDRARCSACDSPHHATEKCHIPSKDGTTVICPYHGVSVKAPKGIPSHHLDGHHRHPPNDQRRLLYCTNMVDLEEALIYDRHGVYRHRLRKAFDKFLVERIRKPFCRVFKNGNCPISIAIDYSNTFCNGQMPEQLKKGWPYTKRDATDPDISARLKACREHDWQDMPKGELEKMSWEDIKEAYGNGRIERQIHCPKSGQ